MANRIRFPLLVLNAVSEAIGAERVGIRMSPFSPFQDMKESDPLATFVPFTQAIVAAQPQLAYVHVVEPRFAGVGAVEGDNDNKDETFEPICEIAQRAEGIQYIAAGGLTPENGKSILQKYGGVVAIGRLYIANPDLLDPWVNGHELNKYDRLTFYTPGTKGYTE